MVSISEVFLAQKKILSRFEKAGLQISDTSDIAKIMEQLPIDSRNPTVHFDLEINDLHTANSRVFCLGKIDGSPEIIGVVALRFDELGAGSLHRFLQGHWARLYQGVGGARVSIPDQPGISNRINGRVGYAGKLWVSEDYRGTNPLSGSNIGTDLSLFGKFSCMMLWQLDWMYAWLERSSVNAGRAARWGYSDVQMSGLRFDVYPEKWPDGLALCACSREQLQLFASYVCSLEQ